MLGRTSRFITSSGSKTRRQCWAQAGARSSGHVGPRELTTCPPLPISPAAMPTLSSVRSMPTGSRRPSQRPSESRCASPAYTTRAWRVTLSDGTALPTYPSTDMGLLTVDLPPGSHELFLDWGGTGVQHAATWLSLITLAGLVVFVWRTNRPRWLAADTTRLPTWLWLRWRSQPCSKCDCPPAARSPPAAWRCWAIGWRRMIAHELNIYPYWYARQNPPADISWAGNCGTTPAAS